MLGFRNRTLHENARKIIQSAEIRVTPSKAKMGHQSPWHTFPLLVFITPPKRVLINFIPSVRGLLPPGGHEAIEPFGGGDP